MVAITYMTGTKYACNLGHKRDLISLQACLQWGPNMLAISNPKRTVYACNLFQKGSNMRAIIKILFSRDSFRNHSHVNLGRFPTLQTYLVTIERDCKHIWSVSNLILQAYLVLFFIKIATILGPHCNHDCKLI